jgi:hypothetical protein
MFFASQYGIVRFSAPATYRTSQSALANAASPDDHYKGFPHRLLLFDSVPCLDPPFSPFRLFLD